MCKTKEIYSSELINTDVIIIREKGKHQKFNKR